MDGIVLLAGGTGAARLAVGLEKELPREKETLRSILEEVGHPYHEAAWMISLMIEQFKVELRWLRRLKRELPLRAAARHPSYAESKSV